MTTPTMLNFREENFRERPPIREIRENFLPRKLPAIRYYNTLDGRKIWTIHTIILWCVIRVQNVEVRQMQNILARRQ